MREYAIERALPHKNILADYFVLMKPGIVALVVVSALTGMYLGSRLQADLTVVFWAMVGIGLSTAASAVLNNYFDRDIDRLMERTASRALAAGTIAPGRALTFAVVLLGFALSLLLVRVNILTAVLTAGAVFIYVVLYGLILKRRSPMANQIGGLAGALPPVLGYAAVTGSINIEAVTLFLLVAIWQQPHALSLALKYRDQYRAAGVPVVPVAKGVRATKVRIFLYTLLLMPVSVLPWLYGMAGTLYLTSVLAAGALYIVLSARFLKSEEKFNMTLFFYSIIYLTALLLAMVVDMRF
ncbi:MAG: heme o synthase [Thermodesulfobacteriota bacterium]